MKKTWLILFSVLFFSGSAFATVSSSTSRIQHNCNGSTIAFTFTFGVSDTDEISVVHADSSGTETELTETTNYTVSCTNDDCSTGGTVTTVATYATGDTITIIRDIPITQESDFTENMPTLYETFETALDKSTRIQQQFSEQLQRTPSLAASSDYAGNEYVFPDPNGGRIIGWNAGGTNLTTFEVSQGDTINVASSVKLLSSYSDFPTALSTIGATECELWVDEDVVLLANAATPSTLKLKVLNGNTFSGAFTLTINGPFEGSDGCFGPTITVAGLDYGRPEWWGAVGDGATDDSDAFDAIAAVGCDIELSAKTYYTDEFDMATADQKLYGPGELKAKANCTGALVTLSANRGIIDGIRINGNVANQANAVGASAIHGVNITGQNCQVINCPLIKDTDGRGVSGQACHYALIANNTFHNNGYADCTNGGGVCLTGANGVRIQGNRVNDPSRYGIRVDTDGTYTDSKDVVIADNVVTEHVETPNGTDCIGITVDGAAADGGNPTYNVSITGNLCENASNTTAGNSYDTNTVINLTFTGNTGIRGKNGFDPDNDAAGVGGKAGGYQTISGNTFVECYNRGLQIQNLAATPLASIISDNLCINCGQGGNTVACSFTNLNGAMVTGNVAMWDTSGTSTADNAMQLGTGITNSTFSNNIAIDTRAIANSKIYSWANIGNGFGDNNKLFGNRVFSELINTNGTGGGTERVIDIFSGLFLGQNDLDLEGKLVTPDAATYNILYKEIDDNHAYRVEIMVVGTKDGDASANYCCKKAAIVHRNGAGAVMTGTVDDMEETDNSGTGADATISVVDQAVIVTVDSGLAGNFNWKCYATFHGIAE